MELFIFIFYLLWDFSICQDLLSLSEFFFYLPFRVDMIVYSFLLIIPHLLSCITDIKSPGDPKFMEAFGKSSSDEAIPILSLLLK